MSDYIAISPAAKELLNSATLLKNLNVNVLISGACGTGKKTLASYILPQGVKYCAKELQQDLSCNLVDLSHQSIIVNDIEKLTNIELFISWANKNTIRIIATTKKEELNKKLKDFFSLTLFIPSLEYRTQDIEPLVEKFSHEAMQLLGTSKKLEKPIINTSLNAISLKKSIYLSYFYENMEEQEIMQVLEKFISKTLKQENAYRDFLYLFEVPLLKVCQKRYKSQVKIAKHLGLNRITLRKKLDTYGDLIQ